MEIKNATFWPKNIYDEDDYKSALDRLNEFIVKNKIRKCNVINIETEIDGDGNHCLNLFYWE